jgi:hypothetical protein
VIDRDKDALPPIPESDAQLMHVLGLAEMDVVEVPPWAATVYSHRHGRHRHQIGDHAIHSWRRIKTPFDIK